MTDETTTEAPTTTTRWWAIGRLGEPVRAIVTGDIDDARTSRLDGEVMAALHTFPNVPTMILPDGSDVVAIPPTLAEAQKAASDTVKAARDAHLSGGCMTPVGKIDTDDASRTNISGSVTMAMLAKSAGQPFTLSWRMSDNTALDLDADMMIGLGVTVGQFVSATYAASFQVLDQIADASTVEEVKALDVQAIVWPA